MDERADTSRWWFDKLTMNESDDQFISLMTMNPLSIPATERFSKEQGLVQASKPDLILETHAHI